MLPLALVRVPLLHVEEFHNEVEIGFRRNGSRTTALAVAELIGNIEFDHSTNADQLHAFGPTLDDLIQSKRNRFVTAVRTVKDRFVVKPTFVVNRNLIGGRWFLSVGASENAVLEAR